MTHDGSMLNILTRYRTDYYDSLHRLEVHTRAMIGYDMHDLTGMNVILTDWD